MNLRLFSLKVICHCSRDNLTSVSKFSSHYSDFSKEVYNPYVSQGAQKISAIWVQRIKDISYLPYKGEVYLSKDSFSLDILLVPKFSKRHFFRDISNSCQWVTQMGLEPHQNFSFEKISKNKAASPILSFLLFWQEIHF